jgi:hypothetical protein
MPLQMQPVVAASQNNCYAIALLRQRHRFTAMLLPCDCHVIAMSMKSDKNAQNP